MTKRASRRPIILEACLADILQNAGVDLDDLRGRIAATSGDEFRTMHSKITASPAIYSEGLPTMRGVVTVCDDGDEITVFDLDLGQGSSYRGSKRGSRQGCSYFLTPGRYPETIVQAMTGLPVAEVIAHPWITDPEPRISHPKKLADGLLLDIAPLWRTL